jgi:predicted RNA-binding protein with RPS1 domain
MPEDQKSGFSEAVETGASAAHTICGAIKTGKAISSAAKGAAAGGPYGAVAGAVWAGRKHIGKIIVAVIALLMLPVLFVLMLPGLIFGGLTNAFSPSDPEIPILNMAEDPLPELTEEEMFGDTPAETDDQSAAPTDMPEDFDVQPPDVYEDNADAVQEPPASPKPKRTSRKKKEAAAPEETVTEEVPAETTESADTADSILDTEEPAVEPDVPVVEEAAAPAPTPSPPQRQPRPQRGEAPVLTIRSRDDVETAEDRDDVIWHEIHNAYRTRKIITGKLGGIEQLDNRKTVAVVDYKGFRVIIPIKEMMINLGRSPSGQEYADLMLRQNKILGNMLGADIDFIVRGIDSKTRSVVASRKEAMLRKRQIFYLDTDAAGMYRVYEGRIVQARVIAVAEKVVRVEVFGVETSILARDLAWDWIGDAHERFSVGDEVLVRILSVRRNSLEDLGIKADIKSISENTDRDNLQKCRIQGKYAGRVTDVHKGVVYVRLSNGVNAVAHSCYDYRMPGKKDDVSFAVTRLDMERGVAVGIITRIIRQNL